MIDLATEDRFVAMVGKVIGKRRQAFVYSSEIDVVVRQSIGIRSRARHQTRARGRADGLLTISPIETHPLRCKRIEIWRLHRWRAVAAKFWPQIIDGYKEDIRFVGSVSAAANE